jgi:hypothetical protein
MLTHRPFATAATRFAMANGFRRVGPHDSSAWKHPRWGTPVSLATAVTLVPALAARTGRIVRVKYRING